MVGSASIADSVLLHHRLQLKRKLGKRGNVVGAIVSIGDGAMISVVRFKWRPEI